MRIFLLLIFSLLAGYEVLSAEEGCKTGWAEFTCNKTKTHKQVKPKSKARFLWYSDEKNGHFKLFTEDLEQKDRGEYDCEYDHGKLHAVKLELQSDKCCLKLYQQTACPSAKATCNVKKCDTGIKGGSRLIDTKSDKSSGKSLGGQKGKNHENISKKGSKGFRFTNTSSGFNLSISDVSLEDAGVYWCGRRSEDGAHQRTQPCIALEVQKIRFFTRSPTVGQNFTYWCDYKHHTAAKFICKGEDPSACKRVGSTAQNNNNNGKFFFSDDNEKGKITITVTRVTVQDTGTYWCGAEASDPECGDLFFHRFIMTVGAPSPGVPTTPPTDMMDTLSLNPKDQEAQAPTASASNSHGGVLVITTALICVAVLLLFVLLLIYIYKRFSHSNTTRNGAPKTVREDYVYEEIHELRPKPESGNAMNSIYVTANCPTNPSALLHYSTINFHKAGGETPRPSSTGCEYSTVKFTQSPNTVIQPSPSTADALYSTVNKPQQQQRNLIPGRDI